MAMASLTMMTIVQAQQETATKAAHPIDMSMIQTEATKVFGRPLPDITPNRLPAISAQPDTSLFEPPEPIKLPTRSSLFNRQSGDVLRQVEIDKLMGVR